MVPSLCGRPRSSSFTVAQGKVSIASAITGKRKKRTVTVYLQPRTVELVARYLATVDKIPDDPLFSAQGRNEWTVYNRKSTKGIEHQTRVGISAEQVRQLFKGWCRRIGLDASWYSTHSIRRGRITASKKAFAQSQSCCWPDMLTLDQPLPTIRPPLMNSGRRRWGCDVAAKLPSPRPVGLQRSLRSVSVAARLSGRE